MASLNNEIIVKQELRPCLVGGVKALFHRWIVHNNYFEALVEFEDGTLMEVSYEEIKFIDNKIKDYCFEETKTDDIYIPDDDDLPF